MPRLKGTFDARRQRDAFMHTVRICMARKGITSQRQFAGMLGLDETILSKRMHWVSKWTLDDIWRMIHILEPTPDEIIQMMSFATAKKDGAA